MWPGKKRFARPVLVFALVAMSTAIARPAGQTASSGLPEPGHPGALIVQRKCILCHDTDLIVQQRLSAAGWTREVDKMMAWGASVNAAEKPALVEYLAQHFAPAVPKPAVESATPARAAEIVGARCTTCHERDLIDQQRLDRAGWTREVQKMAGWGASLTEPEREAVIQYLSGR